LALNAEFTSHGALRSSMGGKTASPSSESLDGNKDQSCFLLRWGKDGNSKKHSIPVGELEKTEVRRLKLKKFGLDHSHKKTDRILFLSCERSLQKFL